MRIGIDVQPLQTGTRYAGVGRHLHDLIGQLVAQNQPETTYTLFLNSADYLDPLADVALTCDRFRVPRKTRLGRFSWCWDTLYLPYAFFRQQIDVYHYNSLSEAEPMAPPFPFGKHKVVATIHDVIPLKLPALYPNEAAPSWKRCNFAAKLRRLRHANAIMTVSECSKHDIMEYLNYPEGRIFVIYNGIAPEFFQEPHPDALAELKQKYELPDRFILYIGGYYSARKNISRLLEAYALLVRQEAPSRCPALVLAGLSAADHQVSIQRLLTEKGLADQVRCLPHIPEAELPCLYRLATLFVYPSLYEGFGLPVAEALACGTVTATSNCSSLPEIAGAACLYFDPCDPQDLAKRIYEGLTTKAIRERLHNQGPKQVARFSWEKTARDVLSVYQSLSQR